MAGPTKVVNKQLDPAVLGSMEEPISIQVAKMSGSAMTPIALPAKPAGDGQEWAPGEGWDRRYVAMLEQWLATEWSGGGMYNIKIVDAKGVQYEWRPYFDPKVYPPKIPPTMAPQGVPMTVTPPQPSPTSYMMPMMQPTQESIDEWPPRNVVSYASYQTPQPQPQQVPMIQQFPSYPPYMQAGRTPSIDEERRRHEEEQRRSADKISQLERDRIEVQHRADLARIEAENSRKLEDLKASLAPKTDDATVRRLDKMEQLMERLVERIAHPVQTGPSPELVALQEQNRKLEDRLEREATERRHAESMNALQRQIEAIAAKPTGPDPMLTIIVDAMKDGQRNMQSVMEGMSKQMLTPQDTLALARQTNSGIDDLRANVVNTFSQMFELQKRAFENAANFLPQGDHPAVRVIEGVVEKATDVIGRYAESKDAAQVASSKAQAAQANAQKAAIDAQRENMTQMAQREMAQAAREQAAAANVAHIGREQPGLNGPSNGASAPNVIPFKAPSTPPVIRLGKTDAEWFGGALPHVEEFRKQVAVYLTAAESGVKPDDKGEMPGINAVQAAKYIEMSQAQILQAGLNVPAFQELVVGERFEDFMMVLLPEAPNSFRSAVLDELIGEEEDDEEDEKPVAVAPPASGKGKPAVPPRPRA